MASKQMSNSNEAPLGVKILSILAYIGAVFTFLAGIFMIFGAGFITRALPAGVTSMMGSGLVGAGLIFVGILFIGFAILDYFVGKGLWKGQNWARILVLVFAVLGLLSSLMPFSLVSLVIDGAIIWYLGFNKEAVAFFS
jgi:hypothetical protein